MGSKVRSTVAGLEDWADTISLRVQVIKAADMAGTAAGSEAAITEITAEAGEVITVTEPGKLRVQQRI